MAPQTAPPSPPISNLPPLLALPLELKLQILSSFSDYDSDPDHALALVILRRTHKSLRDIIPNPWKSAEPAKEHFLAAERQHPYLFPWRCSCEHYPECIPEHYSEPFPLFYPCYYCMRLKDRFEFRNYVIAIDDDEPAPRNINEKQPAILRKCDHCWWAELRDCCPRCYYECTCFSYSWMY